MDHITVITYRCLDCTEVLNQRHKLFKEGKIYSRKTEQEDKLERRELERVGLIKTNKWDRGV